MREIAFIKQNKEKWLEIDQVIQGKVKKNPDDLSSLYISIVNDLSFAQTYYPKSKTTVYLNFLSSQIFQKIYKTKRVEDNKIKSFFLAEVPLIAYQYRRYLLYSICFFLIFTGIGVLSSIYDKEFARLILGDDYINQTLENIKKGDPTAIYGQGSTWGTSLVIILNNIYVGARLYVYGIFGGVGTIYALFQNSVMLGAFQYFFKDQSVLLESAKGIWLHGTFEIIAMIIEAAAGLILGASILFPKTYSRFESFKFGFKTSMKLFLSTLPFTIVAGIIEGYVTRHAQVMPTWINLLIIIISLSTIGFYYGIYPRIIYKKHINDANFPGAKLW
ncbi:stage II sporulation protein M [Chryseobacterium sp. POL2]|uniref:stage II sporulation protein M n=1 Tax=Chryseobacterium sp. POL2 TaxID=2713414 RepID=UPI0013E18C1D|nr:stage II sporulation protein M [Chryseobacterium sp. POL2]QIG89837.1 stage II sporulation protein M [Chryseobacterium sp. POL2]